MQSVELMFCRKVVIANYYRRKMKLLLKDVATVHMGYSFRSRFESFDSGPVAVIQMKDLSDENIVNCGSLSYVDMDKFGENHFVQKGDLIFRSRSLTSTAAILSEDPGFAVVSAPLLKIRLSTTTVMPEYLNWFIRQLPAQIFLTSHARGTTQKMISKETLEMLEIDVPPLEKQKSIIALAALADDEQRIMKQLSIKRKQHISAILIREAGGE
jgi:restriction endonuclease S subunit